MAEPRRRAAIILAAAAGFAAGLATGVGYHAAHPSVSLDSKTGAMPRRFRTTVVRVIDGDTVVLQNGLHLRYRNVNSPEIIEVREKTEDYALEAMELNRSLVENRAVVVETGREGMDRYGRLIGSILLEDGQRVEEVIVSEGLAKVVPYDPEDPLLPAMRKKEAAACAAQKGIWAVPEAKNPPFVAGAESKTYHLVTCPHAARIAEENRVYYPTEEAAAATGRTPCRHCLGGR
ncbi:MAG: thermonuclease family protein [Planctomycetes bacterium]|nr:thermonuclease family protein [Planctomycetota bacterium]